MNVVTTLPSATEVVYALGLEPVGVSHECDYPPEAGEKPAVTVSRIDAEASSGEIDRQVLEAAADEGVYDVDVETLDRLDPELIVTQGVCDVCAVDEIVVERAIDRIDGDPDVLTTDPHTVDDVLGDLERVGRATDRETRAREVVADLEARMDAVRDRASVNANERGGESANENEETSAIDDRPRVAVLDWTDPAMVAGHWVPELVETAGGSYGMADSGEPSRPREWIDVREYDPEVLIVAPCGFGLEQTAENLADLTDRDGWDEITAVEEGRAWAMDGHHYVNRPGPRLVDTLETFAAILRRGAFDAPPEDVAVPLEALERRLEA